MTDNPCTKCNGKGGFEGDTGGTEPRGAWIVGWEPCGHCDGTGKEPPLLPEQTPEERAGRIAEMIDRGEYPRTLSEYVGED